VQQGSVYSPKARPKEFPVRFWAAETASAGRTLKTKLKRSDVERILLDGFLPVVSKDEFPSAGAQACGDGLPFAADAAITPTWATSCILRKPRPRIPV